MDLLFRFIILTYLISYYVENSIIYLQQKGRLIILDTLSLTELNSAKPLFYSRITTRFK